MEFGIQKNLRGLVEMGVIKIKQNLNFTNRCIEIITSIFEIIWKFHTFEKTKQKGEKKIIKI